MYLPNDAYYATLVARSVTLHNILLSQLDAFYMVLGCNLSGLLLILSTSYASGQCQFLLDAFWRNLRID